MSIVPIKTALVVGSGSIAKRHIRNLREQFPEADVVCVSSSGRALDNDEIGASKVLPDLASAISCKPDIAIVASPAPYHLGHADGLLAAQIPVLIEKPLCASLEALQEVDLNRHSAGIGIAYNLRFMPAALQVKKLLENGAIGNISTAFAEVGQYLPDWRPDSNYRMGVSARKALGGGALLELSHELDYLTWFFGPFDRVLGLTRSTGTLDVDVEDSVDAMLEKQDGMVVHVHLDFLQRQACRQFKAVGELGTLLWDLIANDIVILRSQGQVEQIYRDPSYNRNQMYLDQTNAFIRFVQGKGRFESSLESGMQVMQLIEAIRESNKQKTWQTVENKH